jgi:hypothetical protein
LKLNVLPLIQSIKLSPSLVFSPFEVYWRIDASDIKGDVTETTMPFDYLVIGVGAQNSTFGIPGVEQHACFLKEVWDATKIRTRIMVRVNWIYIDDI